MVRARTQRSTSGKLAQLLSPQSLSKAATQKILRAHGFRNPIAAGKTIDRLYADQFQRRNLAKIFTHLIRACEASSDPDQALLGFDRLVAALPNPNMFYHYLKAAPDRLDLLVTVFAHSQALADTLTRNAEHFHFLIAPNALEKPRETSWLAAEIQRLLLPIRVPAQKYDVVRRFRRRETLRIGARDLTGRATVEETTRELSNLADVCLQAVYEIALETLRAQYKLPAAAAAATSRFVIIGMGKLGGQELNYSSDVDVIFVYGEEGNLTPTVSQHDFFTKLAEEITQAVGTATEEGSIFRIDLRLRPEGSSGPIVRSLDSCENYYAAFGETWERMALVKARPVAGDAKLGAEFVEMVQPFVYTRHSSENVLQQMAAIKERIEKEIVREDRLTRHVKLGIGGIREIEFIVQSFQVLRGARLVALRERSTLRALPLLVKTKMLSQPEARALGEAYRFLRNVEHRLQMEMELQTHTIPDEERALYRLARSMGFPTVSKFLAAQKKHTSAVRKVYEAVLVHSTQAISKTGESLLATDKLPDVLASAGFADVPAAVKTVENLQHGPGFVHVSQRTKELFAQLFPMLLAWAKQMADPDAALTGLDKFITAYGSRGLLYETLASNPKLVEMLMCLCDASRFFADTLVRQPELFDEVCQGAALGDPKNLDRMSEELAGVVAASVPDAGRGEAAETAATTPAESVRRWKRGELLRIGIEDVVGLVDMEQMHLEMTCLAEACLRFALEQVRVELKLKKLPFVVIGMGKFGGKELGYGADLDVIFIGGQQSGDQAQTSRLAAKLIEFMAGQTGAGTLFQMDARLRPDGQQGPLASSLEAHRDYYANRAQLWERQALIKARFVAGDVELGKKIEQMIHEIVYRRALTAEELAEIKRMRHRIETERGDQKHVELEFKTGPGGLVDVEFLVQTLQLQYGHERKQVRTAHTLHALNRLTALGIVDEEQTASLRHDYLFLRKIESVLRRVENTSVSKLPTDEHGQTLLAKRLGFATAPDFMKAYRRATGKIRELYDQICNVA